MPDNTLTQSEKQTQSEKPKLDCGELGTYSELKKKRAAPDFERDHVPATNSMLKAGETFRQNSPVSLNGDQEACFKRFVKSDALTIALPKGVHREHSRTCSNRGGDARRDTDAADLKKAANDDMDAVKPNLPAECQGKYEEAREKVLAQLPDKFFKECEAKAKKNC